MTELICKYEDETFQVGDRIFSARYDEDEPKTFVPAFMEWEVGTYYQDGATWSAEEHAQDGYLDLTEHGLNIGGFQTLHSIFQHMEPNETKIRIDNLMPRKPEDVQVGDRLVVQTVDLEEDTGAAIFEFTVEEYDFRKTHSGAIEIGTPYENTFHFNNPKITSDTLLGRRRVMPASWYRHQVEKLEKDSR